MSSPRFASRSWKDLVTLEGGVEQQLFNVEVARKVRNGSNTRYWKLAWKGNVSFMVKYPRLFNMSNQPTRGNSGGDVGERCNW